jgi:hypothetical protein
MISWTIQINGQEPRGWNPSHNGCWFSDDDHQEYLLPYFDVGDARIDPYGGTHFSTVDVIRLRARLSDLRGYIEAKPAEWTVTESSVNHSHTITLRQDEVLRVIDKTMEMTDRAIAEGGGLFFAGD